MLGTLRMYDIHSNIVTFLTLRQMMFAVAVVEIVAGIVLVLSRDSNVKYMVIVALAALFSAYRYSVAAIGENFACNCLGIIGDLFGLSVSNVRFLGWGAWGYLVIPSSLWAISRIVWIVRGNYGK